MRGCNGSLNHFGNDHFGNVADGFQNVLDGPDDSTRSSSRGIVSEDVRDIFQYILMTDPIEGHHQVGHRKPIKLILADLDGSRRFQHILAILHRFCRFQPSPEVRHI